MHRDGVEPTTFRVSDECSNQAELSVQNGSGWTRTNVGVIPADLQSAAIATRRHSLTSPPRFQS